MPAQWGSSGGLYVVPLRCKAVGLRDKMIAQFGFIRTNMADFRPNCVDHDEVEMRV